MSASRFQTLFVASIVGTVLSGCSFQSRESASTAHQRSKTVTVAQSGAADFVGADDAVLQKAVDSLEPGDTLEIGPGIYQMENSLLPCLRHQLNTCLRRRPCGLPEVQQASSPLRESPQPGPR